MKRTTLRNSMLVCALLGVLVAGQAMAVDCRYIGSGDYTNVLSSSGTGTGWSPDGGGPGGLPGSNDTARVNQAANIVTLTNVAPVIRRFQLGVDESGELVVDAGGKLYTTNNSTVGNNSTSASGVVGKLTVNAGGEVYVTNVLFVGNSSANNVTGILTINGGMVRCTSHLWAGSGSSTAGFIYITNGGILNVGGNIGLGTINASTPSGSAASLFVQEGGVLNLNTIDATGKSIQPGSKLDISGSGVVTKTGDFTAVMSAYTNAGRITAYGGAGTVGVDYNNTNVGKTTLWAIAPPAPPPTNSTWTATSGAGTWNQGANWSSGVAPLGVTKVNFNVPGAIPCTVTNPAPADYVVMGENGPGGTLIINNGGSLVCGAIGTNVIGLNSNALMVVENGGSATLGAALRIGLDPDSDGTLVMNGGTVTVAGLFDLGGQGGKGTAQIKGGTLNLSQWDDFVGPIQGASVLDISGTGRVVINGNHQASAESLVSTGQITNSSGTSLIVDYNVINVGKTTIYPADLYLPPAQLVWDPASNPFGSGLWNECDNWAGGSSLCPGNVTFVTFKIADAIPCTLTNAALAAVVRMGNGGPGGTLIITNGGSLTATDPVEWNSIGMNNTGLVVVAAGGSASYGNHLWIGFEPAADGTLILNGGTVSVGGMLGLGWNGGKGTALINGGTLNLAQWSTSSPGSIAGPSVLDVAGTGKVVITGNYVNSISNYVSAGKITANGGANAYYAYYPSTGKTVLSAVVLPPPPQTITAVSVSGGNVTITYQATAQNTYHIEGTPSLSPSSWTPLPGSTNTATGTPVTFSFPASGDQMFYRTVSP